MRLISITTPNILHVHKWALKKGMLPYKPTRRNIGWLAAPEAFQSTLHGGAMTIFYTRKQKKRAYEGLPPLRSRLGKSKGQPKDVLRQGVVTYLLVHARHESMQRCLPVQLSYRDYDRSKMLIVVLQKTNITETNPHMPTKYTYSCK